jgi:hypothetical protein
MVGVQQTSEGPFAFSLMDRNLSLSTSNCRSLFPSNSSLNRPRYLHSAYLVLSSLCEIWSKGEMDSIRRKCIFNDITRNHIYVIGCEALSERMINDSLKYIL